MKYQVTFEITETHTIHIEAEDSDEADEKANDMTIAQVRRESKDMDTKFDVDDVEEVIG